ncbi:MAG: ABC transporter permease [Tannerella sp.]|jgi:ABC-type antimicrobial peptide transport system permease subunit|nr:ABC transporter permease [Tannerella sp.]
MIRHYLTVAFRNLWKYKSQTLISVVGLAVGFTCFALASLWIRYEMTYDGFHRDADRLYAVLHNNKLNSTGVSSSHPYPMAAYLKKTFPEVEEAFCISNSTTQQITVDGEEHGLRRLDADSAFMTAFDIKIVEGNRDFLIPGSGKVAVTEEKARQLYGDESPVGKTVSFYGKDITISAVVTGWKKHGNFPFDFFFAAAPWNTDSWNGDFGPVIIKLKPGTDVKSLSEKLLLHEMTDVDSGILPRKGIVILPLTSLRYKDPNRQYSINIKFQHILIFALAGGLVILCALFNYLTLFISRFRIRSKEFALRKVCGAAGKSLLSLLSVEFLMTLSAAVLLGVAFINIFLPAFQDLSDIRMDLSAVYSELAAYIGTVIACAMTVFVLLLALFRKRTLNASIARGNKYMFRNLSVATQLIIAVGFVFCSVVMVKQIYFLHNTDLGFDYKNTYSIRTRPEVDAEVLENKIKQIPGITETLASKFTILPHPFVGSSIVTEWDGKPSGAEDMAVDMVVTPEKCIRFFNLRLLEGELLSESDTKQDVLIEESTAKVFGWNGAVGKTFGKDLPYKVKGVVRDIYSNSPSINYKPKFYVNDFSTEGSGFVIRIDTKLVFRCDKAQWKACKTEIELMMKNDYPDVVFSFYDAEEEYDGYFRSEDALLKILSFVSLICILISVFGFFSLVSLSCEERRKEIAIRKINGATMRNILAMYGKTYSLLLIAGSAVAFPTGYFIMRRWMEVYVKQTVISVWIYPAIVFVLASVIVLCVGWQVYKASVENPAEAIKS